MCFFAKVFLKECQCNFWLTNAYMFNIDMAWFVCALFVFANVNSAMRCCVEVTK